MELNQSKQKFTSIHEGVGFHPFSDGLPYAPSRRSPQKSEGAISAGAPIYAPLNPSLVNPSLEAVTTTAEPSVVRMRALAYALDCIIHAAFWVATNSYALKTFQFGFELKYFEGFELQLATFYLFSQWFFVAFQEVLFETSAGKAFLGLKFKEPHRSLFFRSLIFLVGAMSIVGFFTRPQDKWGKIVRK